MFWDDLDFGDKHAWQSSHKFHWAIVQIKKYWDGIDGKGNIWTWHLRESCGILTPAFHRKSNISGTVMCTKHIYNAWYIRVEQEKVPSTAEGHILSLLLNTLTMITGKLCWMKVFRRVSAHWMSFYCCDDIQRIQQQRPDWTHQIVPT